MTRINGFSNNYMARRAELFGIIRSNPSWCRNDMIKVDARADRRWRCAIGHVLSVNGFTDVQIAQMSATDGLRIVANMYNLKLDTVKKVMGLNDRSTSFDTSVRAIRSFLLNKNEKRAKDIVGATHLYI